jgi:hypothetical protein
MLDFPYVIVIADGGKIEPRTMRTKLNNDSTHNDEMDTMEKVEGKLQYIASLKPALVQQPFRKHETKEIQKRKEGFEKRQRQKKA